jgi:hypothetical protein
MPFWEAACSHYCSLQAEWGRKQLYLGRCGALVGHVASRHVLINVCMSSSRYLSYAARGVHGMTLFLYICSGVFWNTEDVCVLRHGLGLGSGSLYCSRLVIHCQALPCEPRLDASFGRRPRLLLTFLLHRATNQPASEPEHIASFCWPVSQCPRYAAVCFRSKGDGIALG